MMNQVLSDNFFWIQLVGYFLDEKKYFKVYRRDNFEVVKSYIMRINTQLFLTQK